jgi:hypothetical protein
MDLELDSDQQFTFKNDTGGGATTVRLVGYYDER